MKRKGLTVLGLIIAASMVNVWAMQDQDPQPATGAIPRCDPSKRPGPSLKFDDFEVEEQNTAAKCLAASWKTCWETLRCKGSSPEEGLENVLKENEDVKHWLCGQKLKSCVTTPWNATVSCVKRAMTCVKDTYNGEYITEFPKLQFRSIFSTWFIASINAICKGKETGGLLKSVSNAMKQYPFVSKVLNGTCLSAMILGEFGYVGKTHKEYVELTKSIGVEFNEKKIRWNEIVVVKGLMGALVILLWLITYYVIETQHGHEAHMMTANLGFMTILLLGLGSFATSDAFVPTNSKLLAESIREKCPVLAIHHRTEIANIIIKLGQDYKIKMGNRAATTIFQWVFIPAFIKIHKLGKSGETFDQEKCLQKAASGENGFELSDCPTQRFKEDGESYAKMYKPMERVLKSFFGVAELASLNNVTNLVSERAELAKSMKEAEMKIFKILKKYEPEDLSKEMDGSELTEEEKLKKLVEYVTVQPEDLEAQEDITRSEDEKKVGETPLKFPVLTKAMTADEALPLEDEDRDYPELNQI